MFNRPYYRCRRRRRHKIFVNFRTIQLHYNIHNLEVFNGYDPKRTILKNYTNNISSKLLQVINKNGVDIVSTSTTTTVIRLNMWQRKLKGTYGSKKSIFTSLVILIVDNTLFLMQLMYTHLIKKSCKIESNTTNFSYNITKIVRHLGCGILSIQNLISDS